MEIDSFNNDLPPKPPPSEETFRAYHQLRNWLRQILLSRLPGPQEVLAEAELNYGWKVRFFLRASIDELRHDKTLKSYIKRYLDTVLSDEAISEAMREGVPESSEFRSTIDDLFKRGIAYRKSKAFAEAIAFVARLRHYAPFNNLLVKIQKPSCCYYATEKHWWAEFGRTIKEEARPLLILAPKHPVLLVYDIDDTEGDNLPEKLKNFANSEGKWDPSSFSLLLANAKRDKILVQIKELGTFHGGFATTRLQDISYKMRIAIHSNLSDQSKFSVLCHELAHIYLGHLGTDKDLWWPCRTNLDRMTVEIEAEAVSFIVSARMGLTTSSDAYIASFLPGSVVPNTVSIELIAKVAGKIQEMATKQLPLRKLP